MKDDNTSKVASRRQKHTPHQRLRLEKAKELKRLGVLSRKRRDRAKIQQPDETGPENLTAIAPRIPKLEKDALSQPAKAPAKFRKRQIHKSWLPTHIFHAKRARMTPPKDPLWRFAIPLTPNEKCYRPTHRAATSRGCIAWDMSYVAAIGIEGTEGALILLLKGIGIDEKVLVGRREANWRRGTRWWEGWIRERDEEMNWIAKVGIVWCLDATATQDSGTNNHKVNTRKCQESSHLLGQQEDSHRPEILNQHGGKPEREKTKRKLLMRVHSSAFLQTWTEVLKVAKSQRPPATIEDLRFEIGSIEIIGPESTESLIGALRPVIHPRSSTESTTPEEVENAWVDIETPEKLWPQLANVTNPSCLPKNAILGFDISDPRLHQPPRTVQRPSFESTCDTLLDLLSSWPPDETQSVPKIFDRTKRLAASRQLASQKAINRRKGDARPGEYPAPSLKDPKIPILLMTSRASTTAGQGSWTLLLPWDCVLPVWYSLMHYPLTSGGNPRFGGLQERRQMDFEQAVPSFPADYPGTRAGFEWEMREREHRKQEWTRRPKGKRTAWDSVDLGNGKKGEVGLGWACDWERLILGPPSLKSDVDDKTVPSQCNSVDKESTTARGRCNELLSSAPIQEPQLKELPNPPLNLQHLVAPLSATAPIPATALSPIHLTLLKTGHPTRNARIYRLPTTNLDLRAKWLTLSRPHKAPKQQAPSRQTHPGPETVPAHQRAQVLAANLLAPSHDAEHSTPKAGDPSYPCVPDEDDLIGFVTTGNYNLGEGKCEAIGNVAVARVVGEQAKQYKGGEKNLCIVRESGQSIGRLARWKFV